MTPREVKDELKRRKLSQAEIARRAGVSIQHVHFVIEGKATSKPVEKKIARALGMKLAEYRAARSAQPAAVWIERDHSA